MMLENVYGPIELTESDFMGILRALMAKDAAIKKSRRRHNITDYQDITTWPVCLIKSDWKYYYTVHRIGHCPHRSH